MVWKAGCITILIGVLATVGSCALFGTAVDRALERRQVYDRAVTVGSSVSEVEVTVDPEASFELRIEVDVALTEEELAAEGESGGIVTSETPVAFVVHDRTGNEIAQGAGRASGTVIVPALSHPSRDSFDGRVDCTYTSPKFQAPETGDIVVIVDVPDRNDAGGEVLAARLIVSDRIAGTATIGVVVFVIGLLIRAGASKSKQAGG
jgi:hypothetical protein